MLDFNWGIFWAVAAAFAVRGMYRGVRRFVQMGSNTGQEITLRDIWERM